MLANKNRKTSYSDIIEKRKIFLARTSPTKAGTDLASILGTLHLTGLQAAGISRQSKDRRVFTVIADEFGNYSNPRNVAHALRTLRKFGICLILATQNIQALPTDVIQATSNIGSHVAFQQGWDDAQHYYKAFAGQISNEELLSKKVGEAFAKFDDQFAEIKTHPPRVLRDSSIINEVRRTTRQNYCIPLEQVNRPPAKAEAEEDLNHLDLL